MCHNRRVLVWLSLSANWASTGYGFISWSWSDKRENYVSSVSVPHERGKIINLTLKPNFYYVAPGSRYMSRQQRERSMASKAVNGEIVGFYGSNCRYRGGQEQPQRWQQQQQKLFGITNRNRLPSLHNAWIPIWTKKNLIRSNPVKLSPLTTSLGSWATANWPQQDVREKPGWDYLSSYSPPRFSRSLE